jgi:hypothetical protein
VSEILRERPDLPDDIRARLDDQVEVGSGALKILGDCTAEDLAAVAEVAHDGDAGRRDSA